METDPQEEQQEVALDEALDNAGHVEEVQDEQSQDVEHESSESVEDTTVPLTALQKERQRRKDERDARYRAEAEAKFYREQAGRSSQQPEEEDDSLYDSATRKDLQANSQQTKAEAKREIKEELWIDSNPDKAAFIDEHLEEFLTKKPHYATAIKESGNRYAEAYDLLTRFIPRSDPKPVVKRRAAPNSPNSVPKTSSVNEAVDVMNMSDEEYLNWRASKSRRR